MKIQVLLPSQLQRFSLLLDISLKERNYSFAFYSFSAIIGYAILVLSPGTLLELSILHIGMTNPWWTGLMSTFIAAHQK